MVVRADTGSIQDTNQQQQVQQSQMGAAQADPNEFRKSNSIEGGIAETSGDRIIGQVLQAAGQVMQVYTKTSREDAYLDGVAKAGTIENEQQLQGNIFTRDWATAGYRDTMGKLADADNQASIAADMKRTREMPPEQYREYLAEKRKPMLETFEGMSRAGRTTAFANQMTQERANIKKHGAEHYAYIIETEQKAVRATTNQNMRNLDYAKGAPDSPNGETGAVYGAASTAAYMGIYQSVYANPKLPNDVKANMLHEMAQNALDTDHLALYKQIMDRPVGEGVGPMGDMLDDKQRHGLSAAYRSSMDRTSGMRLHQMSAEKGAIEAGWGDTNQPLMGILDVNAKAQQYLGAGLLKSSSDVEAFYQSYYKAASVRVAANSNGLAWGSGNQSALNAANISQEEGLSAWKASTGRFMGIPEQIQALAVIGTQHGQGIAFKEIGRLLGPGFASMGQDVVIDPAMAAGMRQTFTMLDSVDKDGKTGAYTQFFGGLSADEQTKAVYLRDQLRKGVEPAAAMARAAQMAQDDSQMSPELKAAHSQQNAKDDLAAIAALDIQGPISAGFGTVVGAVKGMFGFGSTSNREQLTTTKGWFESDQRVQEVAARSKLEFSKELQLITKANPNMPSAARQELALANVAGRTVQTAGGPFTVPLGTDLKTYFGTGNTDRIGKALDTYLAVGPDNRMAVTSNPAGGLTFTEYNNKSQVVRSGNFDPKVVNGIIEKDREALAEKFKVTHGAGITTKGDTGVPVTFNGDNSADVDNEQMLKFRQSLVKHEGVRDTPYDDLSGKVVGGKRVQTVGVGVSSHNPAYPKPGADGKVTQEQINQSFMRASSSAAKAAARVMHVNRLQGDAAFQLTAELAYQAGNNFDSARRKGAAETMYQGVFKAISDKDVQAAVAAFKTTPAWQMSGDVRKRHYEGLIQQLARK